MAAVFLSEEERIPADVAKTLRASGLNEIPVKNQRFHGAPRRRGVVEATAKRLLAQETLSEEELPELPPEPGEATEAAEWRLKGLSRRAFHGEFHREFWKSRPSGVFGLLSLPGLTRQSRLLASIALDARIKSGHDNQGLISPAPPTRR